MIEKTVHKIQIEVLSFDELVKQRDALQAKLDRAKEIMERAAQFVGSDYDDISDAERMDGTEEILTDGLKEMED